MNNGNYGIITSKETFLFVKGESYNVQNPQQIINVCSMCNGSITRSTVEPYVVVVFTYLT